MRWRGSWVGATFAKTPGGLMKRMHAGAVGAMTLFAAGLLSASAGATPAEGDVERTDLAKGTTTSPIWIVTAGQPTTFYVQNLVLKPGARSGWHAHPGPEQSVITRGAVVLRTAANCAPVVYTEGQAVFILGGIAHEVVNEGTADAEVVVTYTLPADAAPREDAPAICQ
ncbi:cupin [Mycolicibacterium mageritense]|uniref:Cupin n=3 Tax=Mycobacteriaceae TaxID=1762 RepID=A0ABM7HNS0_MYCME|nr:cupin [Mycolicibacterium mageritense]